MTILNRSLAIVLILICVFLGALGIKIKMNQEGLFERLPKLAATQTRIEQKLDLLLERVPPKPKE